MLYVTVFHEFQNKIKHLPAFVALKTKTRSCTTTKMLQFLISMADAKEETPVRTVKR